jgi:LysM repeat protein
MSKIKFIAKQFAVSVIFLFLLSSVRANDTDLSAYHSVSPDELRERLDDMSNDVELKYTPEVHSIINEYIKGYRKGSEVLLGRGGQYFPIYDNEFQKAGLPTELKYLSAVESSLIPTARSNSGAVGLWQFISSTGKIYGLTINSTIDERKDPIRSTQAAAKFLSDLYDEFGDWSLALAAYNCGPGGVKKATRRSATNEYTDFWNIKSYLPKETRRYVPKYVAVSYVMNYFQHHGLEPILENSTEVLATVKVYEYTTFSEISRKTGLDYATIKRLNPAYLKGYIPQNTKGYYLTLPEKIMYDYVGLNDTWNDLEYRPQANSQEYYTSLLYGNMRRRAQKLSHLEMLPTLITVGTSIASLEVTDEPIELPLDPSRELMLSDVAILENSTSAYKYHILQPLQSLEEISDMFDITLKDLVRLNEIDIMNPPAPGTMLIVDQVAEEQ